MAYNKLPIINQIRDMVRPSYKENNKPAIFAELEGSENFYNYLSKSLKELYLQD